jgi:hypothetical protein
MRGVAGVRHRALAFGVFVLAGLCVSGCKTVEGGPDRLYSVPEEVAQARVLLDVEAPEGVPGLVKQYYTVDSKSAAADDARRMYLRNEIIARRMYIIDVEYSEYESALTNERQKFGFATALTAQGLTLASAVVTPLRSAQILGAAASGVGAARGFYDSEIVVAKTIQIAQGHMRAKRDDVAKRILSLRTASSVVYPLSAALRDLEDYYNAGTLAVGLVEALGQSGQAAQEAAAQKADVITGVYSPDESTAILLGFLRLPGSSKLDPKKILLANACLPPQSGFNDVRSILTDSSMSIFRVQVVSCLRLR